MSDFPRDQDSEILVRERAHGSKLESANKRKKGRINVTIRNSDGQMRRTKRHWLNPNVRKRVLGEIDLLEHQSLNFNY